MPSTEILIGFTAAALLINISPGPSNLYVMAQAIAQGTQGGIIAVMGLATGSLIHVIAAVLGISTVFSFSPALYTVVKIVGATYLMYLGIRYWKSNTVRENKTEVQCEQKALYSIFRKSVIVEVTNPKTALFFIALLPQFVVPGSGPVSLQLLVLGLIVTISALPCDFLVAVSSSKVSRFLAKHKRAEEFQERISGSILFGIGVFIVSGEVLSIRG